MVQFFFMILFLQRIFTFLILFGIRYGDTFKYEVILGKIRSGTSNWGLNFLCSSRRHEISIESFCCGPT